MIKIIKPDFIFNDNRGSLTQIIHDGFKQINYIFSVGGSFRGGHYHRLNIECFYVIKGKFEIVLELEKRKEIYTFQTGDLFCIEPMVIHSFHYIDDTQMIGMYDVGIENSDGTKDIYEVRE